MTDGKSLPRLSKATYEAIFVATLRNFEFIESLHAAEISKRYSELLTDPKFSAEALKEGLADKVKVKERLERAIEIFKND